MNKKSQAFLEFMLNYGWAIMLILVFIAILAYFSAIDKFQVESYCVQNPDKCVCEEAKPYCNKGYSLTEQVKIGGYFNNSLNSFWYTSIELQCCKDDSKGNDCQETKDECIFSSKKTQLELDIDDCNNNPREDDLCECISTINQWTGEEIDNIFNIREVKISCDENGTCLYYKCIKSRPKTDWEKHPENYIINDRGIYVLEYWGGVVHYNQTTYRLKNECEKGNRNLIQYNYESDGIQYEQCYEVPEKCNQPNVFCDGLDTPYKTLILKNDSCSNYKINNPICRKKNQCELNNPDYVEETIEKEIYGDWKSVPCPNQDGDKLNLIYCGFANVTMINETICREKTDAEKLENQELRTQDEDKAIKINPENWKN